MRRLLIPTLAALLAAAFTAGIALAGRGHDHHRNRTEAYAIGLWGDLPYSTGNSDAAQLQKTVGVPNLIADMNRQPLAFSVHDGDLKDGSSRCSDDKYYDFKASLNTLRAPAVFTPGDNDWTDCDRASAGGYDSEERLRFERSVLFSDDFSLGQRRMRLEVQDAPYVENRRWTVGGVTYATLNVQGSCNNLCGDGPSPTEYAARTAADLTWLHAAFAAAKRRHSAALMLIWQADPGWDDTDAKRAPLRDAKTLAETDGQPDGFQDLLVALRDETVAFRRPVALVNGDSHYFRIDKPLQDAAGRRVENFTRVETFGDHQENGTNDVNWLKVTVEPDSREVFSYQPQIVPGNRTAVPPPEAPR
jgi:hypothetical protein